MVVQPNGGTTMLSSGRHEPRLYSCMRFVVGADDEGEAADVAVDELRRLGHEVEVLERDRWPDVAGRVARAVASGDADQGLLFCWTGTGTAMAANKVHGVRAALAWDPWIAEGARRWNDANVLVMSLKRTTPTDARAIVAAWLSVEAPDEDELENIAKLNEL
jgi:ribose 5-phosphate isomerase B